METVFGQPSWKLASEGATAWITRQGAMLGPVRFRLGERFIEPYHVAPWAEEGDCGTPILQALRGDFLCAPFGGNEGSPYPLHGPTANLEWKVGGASEGRLRLELNVERLEAVREIVLGPSWVMQRHRLRLSEPMPVGMHAMLRFRTIGRVHLSPYDLAATPPVAFEKPEMGGYAWLPVDARFDRLEQAPGLDGQELNLTAYPLREGWENLVQCVRKPSTEFAWTAVCFPDEGYLWYSVRRASVLPHTLLWYSNGGRHYAPWNGRHRAVLGLEDLCGFFHLGQRASSETNWLSQSGYPTSLNGEVEWTTLSGVLPMPGHGALAGLRVEDGRVVVCGDDGSESGHSAPTQEL